MPVLGFFTGGSEPKDPARLPPDSGAGIVGMGLGAAGRVLNPPVLLLRLFEENAGASSRLAEREYSGAELKLLLLLLLGAEVLLLLLL